MPELRQTEHGELQIVPDASALSDAAVQEFVNCAQQAIGSRGQFSVALSGGNTPRNVFSLLAAKYKDTLPWSKVHIFFGDERNVPPDDAESNYRMARESLLEKVPLPKSNVHRIRAELPAQQAASLYSEELRAFFKLSPNQWPRLDLIMLGLGDEGHTASLFPDSTALAEDRQLVVANWVEKFHTWRITFTFPVINYASQILFLVSGAAKAEIIRDIFDSSSKDVYPAQRVRPIDGRLLWIVDKAAAARIL
jgi:6-phosphogluconolactonase